MANDDDLQTTVDRYKKFVAELPIVSKVFGDKKAAAFLNQVSLRTPVDTGNLRENWKCISFVSTGDLMLLISNPVEYASFVEYGHLQHPGQYVPKIGRRLKASFVNGKYMMTKTIDFIRQDVGSEYEAEVNNLWRRCGLG